ncbi:MAG: tetratricopeptide repeat protein, partial [Promethearchaeota archaeon]
DLNRDRIRVHPTILKRLNVRSGDIVAIRGQKESAGIIWANSLAKGNIGIACISSRLRTNTDTEIGDIVELEKVDFKIAQKITIAPVLFKINNTSDLIKALKNRLISRPITKGDYIFFQLGLSAEYIFEVVNLKPEGICIVNIGTELEMVDEPIEKNLEVKEKLIRKTVHNKKPNSVAWESLANLYCAKGEYEKAANVWASASKFNPFPGSPWVKVGLFQQDKGENEETIKSFKKAIEENSQDKDAFLYLGYLHILDEEYDKAIEIFNQVIEFYPTSSIAWTNLCYIFIKQEKFDKAIKAGNLAIEFKPLPPSWHHLGTAYQKVGDYQNAIKNYKKAVRRNKSYKEAFYSLAQAYFDTKEYQKALGACKKCLKIDPEFEDAQKLSSKTKNFIE